MAVRTVVFKIDENGITPNSYQYAGVQGEHKATVVQFRIESSLLNALTELGGEIYYRFDLYNALGIKESTAPEKFEIADSVSENGESVAVEYTLENSLTRDGGNIQVVLVLTEVSENTTGLELYSFPALLRLNMLPDGNYEEGNYESVSTLAVIAATSAERAENAADAAETASEQTLNARFTLENGAEFIVLGGDAEGCVEVELAVDDELSDTSTNPIQNKAVAEELKKYTTMSEVDKKYETIEQHDADIEELYNEIESRTAVYGQYTPILYSGGIEITHNPRYMYGFYVKSDRVVHINISIKTCVTGLPNDEYASISLPDGLPLSTTGTVQWNMVIPNGEVTNMLDSTIANGYLEINTPNIIRLCNANGGALKWLVKEDDGTDSNVGWLKLSGWYITD